VKVRIGIAESNKVIEFDVDDPAAFEKSIEAAHTGNLALLWFNDSRKRRVGIPRDRVSYVEIETVEDRQAVGFGPG
jgi:hypothetical protein